MNKDELFSMSQKYKKIEFDRKEDFRVRHSFLREMNVHDARMLFKIRTQMVPTIQMNFPSDRAYTANNWTCSACNSNLDTQSHVMVCKEYSTWKVGLNLDEDIDCVKFFKKVVSLRTISVST